MTDTRPGIKTHKSEEPGPFKAPDGFWIRCEGCRAILRASAVEENLNVCTECNKHFRVGSVKRLQAFCDPGSFQEKDAELKPKDILDFFDSKPYIQRIEASIKKTRMNDAFVSGSATLFGRPIEVGAFEFSFMGGSMGTIVGEKVSRVFDRAYARRCPAVVFHSSGGARMQEGLLSLMQMAKTTVALSKMKEAGIPYFSVMTDPTTGGVAASFAMIGDVNIAEPEALVGFAGPRVIEQTINQKLPPGFQRAEFLLQHGMIDAIVPRRDLRAYIDRMSGFLFDG